jgi:hypothetical protein
MRSAIAALIAACLAFILTVASAELIALSGYRNAHVNTAICCVWLIVVFRALQRQSRQEN